MCYTKDLAKVFSGIALAEIINHTLLAASTTLPIHFFGIAITPLYNLLLLVIWIALGAFSVYYAWIKKERSMFDRFTKIFAK